MNIDAKLDKLIELLTAIYMAPEDTDDELEIAAEIGSKLPIKGPALPDESHYYVMQSPVSGKAFVWCHEPRGDSYIEYIKLLSDS